SLRSDLMPALLNLAVTLTELGQCDEAAACCRRAVAAQPRFPEAHNCLGIALAKAGQLEEAAASYSQAAACRPNYGEAHLNLAVTLLQLGRAPQAVAACRQALALIPGHDGAVSVLADAFARVEFPAVSDAFLGDLCALMEHPAIAPRQIDETIMRALRLHPHVQPLLADPDRVDFQAVAPQLGGIPLLLGFMALTIVPAVDFERLFSGLRRSMLGAWQAGTLGEAALPLAAALAHQSFIADYAWYEEPAETAAIATLADQMATGGEIDPKVLLVVAAYRPLHGLTIAQSIADRAWPAAVDALVTRQVREPLQERVSRAGIPALTPVAEGVSRDVQAQYEENPYPRWTKIPRTGRPPEREPFLHAVPAQPDILVAGCGTGYHALMVAADYPGARILAVDLSRASLAYASRKTRELGVASVEYAQADILELGRLDRRFDVVESLGVLHHMAEPMAGWRVLTGLLKPGGLMKIGLYSDLARAPHVRARELIAAQGYAADAAGIRQARHDITARAAHDPVLAGLLSSRDFYNASECRDLIFHVQEHRTTIPDIHVALAELGLEFVCFVLPDPSVAQAFRQAYPGVAGDAALACWNEFERAHPNTFRQMYQFWLRKPA
ncbi:MAG TPA: methyltransferase domain-containing protein, partial [Magnetospirillum sp.]|nr:methyltransferase domain-containing protein [Magnetospirillum sp.]